MEELKTTEVMDLLTSHSAALLRCKAHPVMAEYYCLLIKEDIAELQKRKGWTDNSNNFICSV